MLQVIAVYRRCATCGKYKKLGNFKHSKRSHKCSACRVLPRTRSAIEARAYALTDLGHRVARKLLGE